MGAVYSTSGDAGCDDDMPLIFGHIKKHITGLTGQMEYVMDKESRPAMIRIKSNAGARSESSPVVWTV